MTILSRTQADILHAAAHAEDGATAADPQARSSAAGLIRRGLLISIPRADGHSRLLITAAGRTAIVGAAMPDKPKIQAEASDRLSSMPPLVGPSPSGPTTESSPLVVPPSQPKGKVGALVALLRQPDGTTLEAMMAATGWQKHSVRGALSGAIKKGLGLEVISEKTDTGRSYRLPAGDRA